MKPETRVPFQDIANRPEPRIWPKVVVALVLIAGVIGYNFDAIQRLFR